MNSHPIFLIYSRKLQEQGNKNCVVIESLEFNQSMNWMYRPTGKELILWFHC